MTDTNTKKWRVSALMEDQHTGKHVVLVSTTYPDEDRARHAASMCPEAEGFSVFLLHLLSPSGETLMAYPICAVQLSNTLSIPLPTLLAHGRNRGTEKAFRLKSALAEQRTYAS